MTTSLFQLAVALVISIGSMILLTRYLNVHAFFSLLAAGLSFGLLAGQSFLATLGVLQTGFGALLQQIGLLVAIGSCLGMMMEKTGAMEVIGHRVVKLFGAKRAILATTVIGLLVGIPVFCDSGFIILSRLIPSMAAQSSASAAQLSLALSSGLYTTHTLVPPTPGPLAAAANLNLSSQLGTVIFIGLLTSIPVGVVSYLFSRKLGSKISLPVTDEKTSEPRNLHPLLAFLPLALPILLIGMSSLLHLIIAEGALLHTMSALGHPVVALAIGLLTSFFLLDRNKKNNWPSWISEALKDAGIILLITGAGGAFGGVIKASGIDLLLKGYIDSSSSHGVAFLLIAFAIGAVLKTAQGSTTSAIIITSSLLAPLAATAGFTTATQLSILVAAIGGGAMTVSHANDSYFWVVSQFSGMAPRDAMRSFTPLTLLQGCTALATAIFLFLVL